MERENRRRPPQRGGPNPMLVVVGGVLLVAALVVYVNVAGQGGGTAKEAAAEKPYDPFAGVPEEQPRRAASSKSADVDMATAGDSPFGSVASFLDDPIWVAADEKASRADALLQEALDAHDAGDRTTAKEKGGRAQALFTEALAETLPLEERMREEHGNESRPVLRIGSQRHKWNQKVMTLKKSAFL